MYFNFTTDGCYDSSHTIQSLWKYLVFCQTKDEFGLILLILNMII